MAIDAIEHFLIVNRSNKIHIENRNFYRQIHVLLTLVNRNITFESVTY